MTILKEFPKEKPLSRREAIEPLSAMNIVKETEVLGEETTAPIYREKGERIDRNLDVAHTSIVVTPMERGVTLTLLLFGMIPLFLCFCYLFLFHPSVFDPKQFALVFLLGIFGNMVMELYPILLLWGFQRLDLPTSLVKWLGIATIGGVTGLLVTVYGYLFKT